MQQQWTKVNGMLYYKRILHLIIQAYDGKNMHVNAHIFNNLNHINVYIFKKQYYNCWIILELIK